MPPDMCQFYSKRAFGWSEDVVLYRMRLAKAQKTKCGYDIELMIDGWIAEAEHRILMYAERLMVYLTNMDKENHG